MREALRELTELGCWDFRLESFDGWRLRVLGGTSLAYPGSHLVAAEFAGVSYIGCSAEFSHARFRLATRSEAEELGRRVPLEAADRVVVIEAETASGMGAQRFVLVAESVRVARRAAAPGTSLRSDRPAE